MNCCNKRADTSTDYLQLLQPLLQLLSERLHFEEHLDPEQDFEQDFEQDLEQVLVFLDLSHAATFFLPLQVADLLVVTHPAIPTTSAANITAIINFFMYSPFSYVRVNLPQFSTKIKNSNPS